MGRLLKALFVSTQLLVALLYLHLSALCWSLLHLLLQMIGSSDLPFEGCVQWPTAGCSSLTATPEWPPSRWVEPRFASTGHTRKAEQSGTETSWIASWIAWWPVVVADDCSGCGTLHYKCEHHEPRFSRLPFEKLPTGLWPKSCFFAVPSRISFHLFLLVSLPASVHFP